MSDLRQSWTQSLMGSPREWWIKNLPMMGDGQGGSQPLPVPGASSPSPSPNTNPLSAGINTGMKAARHSYDMDEEQKEDAMRSAMSTLTSQAANPFYGSGFAGALGALNANLNPAIQNYLSHKDKYREQNKEHVRYLAREEREMAREQREQKRLDLMMSRDMAQINRANKAEDRLFMAQERQYENEATKRIGELEAEAASMIEKREKYVNEAVKSTPTLTLKSTRAQEAREEYDRRMTPYLKQIDNDIKRLKSSQFGSNPQRGMPTAETAQNEPSKSKNLLTPEQRKQIIAELNQ